MSDSKEDRNIMENHSYHAKHYVVDNVKHTRHVAIQVAV